MRSDRRFLARGCHLAKTQGAGRLHCHGRLRNRLFFALLSAFDKIKIDQSFISNLGQNNQSATIVRAVIGLARGLKLPVLAEGVETEEQLAFLKNETCDEILGYLVGQPLPIKNYTALTGQPESERPDKLD